MAAPPPTPALTPMPALARLRALAAAAAAQSFDHAPKVAAAASFLAGALALVITASNAAPGGMPALDVAEALAQEWPDLTASVAAVALMALAVGLRRRLDAAWAATVALLAFFAFYALVRHEHEGLAIASGMAAFALALAKRSFFRRARLSAFAPSPTLAIAIAGVLAIAALGGLLWAADRPGFTEAPWWALLFDPGLGRPGRLLVVAGAAIGAAVFWQALIEPERPKPPPGAPEDLSRALAILGRAEDARPEAQLARLGDKRFVFTAKAEAFVMAAPWGGSFIAMGGPVGQRAAWRAALSGFRDEAGRLGKRPVIYAAPPDLLPDLLDAGFHVEKIGETAVIALKSFSLSGKAKQDLRTSRRRLAEREGATFSVETFVAGGALEAELAPVSQAWLATQKGGEKGFSLGRFDPDFLNGTAVAIVRAGGRAIAFATIWTTPDARWAALDLMRYDPAVSPPSTMDFIITECLLWAQREGFAFFDLGLAPLSGLAGDRHAPLFAKLGRLVYQRGGALYNFEGLRRFKEKFGPSWEPRYLAATGAFAMPLVLAEVALLTSGGPLALLGAPKRKTPDAATSGPEEAR